MVWAGQPPTVLEIYNSSPVMHLLTFYCGHEDMLGTRYIFCSCWFKKKRNIRQLIFQCSFTNGVLYHHHSMTFKSLPRPSLPSTPVNVITPFSLPDISWRWVCGFKYNHCDKLCWHDSMGEAYSMTRRRNAALIVVVRSPKIEVQWNLTFTVPPSGGHLFFDDESD